MAGRPPARGPRRMRPAHGPPTPDGGSIAPARERRVSAGQVQRITANASVAKFGGTDLAVNACMKAMEILGEDANDARWGVEKCLRDAKLGQIFEGTNQICRLHTNRGLLAR